jgi:hypothetical protein
MVNLEDKQEQQEYERKKGLRQAALMKHSDIDVMTTLLRFGGLLD